MLFVLVLAAVQICSGTYLNYFGKVVDQVSNGTVKLLWSEDQGLHTVATKTLY